MQYYSLGLAKKGHSQVGVPVYSEGTAVKPAEITKNAVEEAKRNNIDAIVVDTAGRLQVRLLYISFTFSVYLL